MGEEQEVTVMDANEQIKKFTEFIDLHCKPQLVENVRTHKYYLIIDFAEL